MDFNAASLQNLEQRNPIHTSGFHRHRIDTTPLQPVRQIVQILRKGGKRSHRVGVSIGGHSNEDLRGSHVNTASVGSHFRQTPVQLPMFSSLGLRHGSSPFVKFGNEPGVQEIEISQAGSSQHKHPLRVTNVIGHGPGIKLLNGLAEASTNGNATYAYRCRVPLLRFIMDGSGPMLKFLTVIGPRRAGRSTPKFRRRAERSEAGWFPFGTTPSSLATLANPPLLT